jgi:hypothetical protein
VDVVPKTGYAYVLLRDAGLDVISGTQRIASLTIITKPVTLRHVLVDPASEYAYLPGYDYTPALFGPTEVARLVLGQTPCAMTVDPNIDWTYLASCDTPDISILGLRVVPDSVTPGGLFSVTDDLIIDFGEPIVTSTIRFAISPTVPFTVTWSPESDRATIAHATFEVGASYRLNVLPGGRAASGLTVAEKSFDYIYLPFHMFLPVFDQE